MEELPDGVKPVTSVRRSLPPGALMVLLAGMASVCPAAEIPDVMHVVVRRPDQGRAFGWPANGGIWSWGNEILVMYLDCPYRNHRGFSNHDSDQTHASARWVTSRSYDGGLTWRKHRIAFPDPRANPGASRPVALKMPINFRDPNVIVNFHWDGLGTGAKTFFYASADRGVTWDGPYNNIPLFDFTGIAGRTDYRIDGRHALTAYMGCIEVNHRDCYRESSYAVATRDGGRTWRRGPRISRPLAPAGKGHRVEYGAMPSTARVDARMLVAAFRSGYTPNRGRRTGWIDLTGSVDNGKTWKPLNGRLMELPTLNSTPPALNALPGGRLVCSWGYRLPDDGSGPTAIQARVSDDGGATWGKTITLRRDGFDYDIGYNRQVVRPDGKIVTVYYYRTRNDGQSPTYIAATIWAPPAAVGSHASSPSDRVYYVDAVRGNDANPGTRTAPWRTLQRAADRMRAGDTALVRTGTYRETVRPRSGQTFAAYQDERPLITGCDTVRDWSVHAGRVYRAKVDRPVRGVFVAGKLMQKARWPNEDGDPLTCREWRRTNTSLVSSDGRGIGKAVLNGTDHPHGHWVGGWYCGVNGKNPFMVAEGRITASHGDELTCSDLGPGWKGVYGRMWGDGRGYITDHLNCLDAEREWHWQTGVLYYGRQARQRREPWKLARGSMASSSPIGATSPLRACISWGRPCRSSGEQGT